MGNIPEVFISSAHYGLEDLRAALNDDLTAFGVGVQVSSEAGFPVTEPNLPPYAQCIKVLERCALVVGVIDKRYGAGFAGWGRYTAYAGLSPTHGELRHAIRKRIPLNVFVRKSVWTHYESFRSHKSSGTVFQPPKGYDIETFEMLEEVKLAKPAPWIEAFDDVRDVAAALRRRLLGYLGDALAVQHKLNRISVERLRKKLLALDPATRKVLEHAIENNPKALGLLNTLSPAKPPGKPAKSVAAKSTNPSPPVTGNSFDKAVAMVDLVSALLRLAR